MAEERPIEVIIVDDSIVVRGIVSRLLRSQPGIRVVSTAIDGVMAIEHTRSLLPDIVILDIEMPNMDGLTALPKILEASPKTKVLIASTLTERNADISMKALELGASDYLQKPNASDREEMERFSRELTEKIYALVGREDLAPGKTEIIQDRQAEAGDDTAPPQTATIVTKYPAIPPKALAIASSTGGPQALTALFTDLSGYLLDVPIFITQHMPPAFTTILATNIASVSGKHCKEAEDNEIVRPGAAYVAPGDYHLLLQRQNSDIVIKLNQGEMENFCRPSADPMLRSLVEIYGNQLLLVVLTGMGHDGLNGAQSLVNAKGTVVAQDKESSVVWGMPKAVTEAGLVSAILPLEEMAHYIKRAFGEVG